MKNQSDLWIAVVLIAVLFQSIAAIDIENAGVPLYPNNEEDQLWETLDQSETSFFESLPSDTDFLNNYQQYHLFHPSDSENLPSDASAFSNSFLFDSGKKTTNSIHEEIKCGDNFPRTCKNSRYRTYDGSCNNLLNPTWGMANTRYGRLIPARYSDGMRAPTKSIIGEDLPLARTVSYKMFPNIDLNDRIWTLNAMQYGQIMTHDMGLIDGTTEARCHRTECCSFRGKMITDLSSMPQCYPIIIPLDDPVYSKYSMQCLNFVRSSTDLDHGCQILHKSAEQLNTVTHYMDLSLVYGSSDIVAANLRAGYGGRMNVEMKNNRQFPPPAFNKSAICDTVFPNEPCYATGDTRGNQNPQLTVLQIILLREHNRIADFLSELNPRWSDETIFQETRRIVIAEHQKISYYEWLPIFLGLKQVFNDRITYFTDGYVKDYDPTVNANVLNEHSNAVMRYFHSLIVGNLNLVSKNRDYSPFVTLRLSDHFNRPGIIEKGNNLDDLTRGLSYQPQKATDVYFDPEITQSLFRKGRPIGSDLRATDIQRDRDHAIASYNDYREYCGLPRAKDFVDFADYISLSDIRKLAQLYENPDDVELTVGGALEKDIAGTLAGPTFSCIMTRQFQMTRIGDRYWFETADPEIAFTFGQLNEIRKTSVSRLLCDNGDNIQYMQRLGFVQVSEINPLLKCEELLQVNLTLWKDYNSANHDSIPQYK